MKTFIISFKNLNSLLLIGFIFFLLTSCGTYKKDYDEVDGIYSSTQNNEVVEEITGEEDKNNYYKQYFKTKQSAYKDVPEDNAILTDVEAYYTSETLDEEGYVISEEQEYGSEYNEGNGAWGSNSTQVSINVYGGIGYAPFYGGWGNPYYGYGWGIPFYGGWGNSYYGYGWGNPYYGYGWGNPYYGYGWGNPYYGYGGNYGGGYSYAYNRGRRNTDYLAGSSSLRGSNITTSSNRRVNNNRYSSSFGTTNSRRGSSSSRTESNRRFGNTNSSASPSIRPNYQGNSSSRANTTRKSPATTRPMNTSRSNTITRSSSLGAGSSRGGGGRRGGI